MIHVGEAAGAMDSARKRSSQRDRNSTTDFGRQSRGSAPKDRTAVDHHCLSPFRHAVFSRPSVQESIEEQRKKAKLETQSAELDVKEDAQKEPQLKKDKNKRWVPPPRTEPVPQRGPLPPFREKGSRFSGGPDHVRRQRRDRWRDRSYSPPQKRRRTPKGRPASRSRSPRRRHDVKSRPSRKPHRRSRSPDRSPSWERNRARRSRSPKLDRNRRRPSNERKHRCDTLTLLHDRSVTL